MNTIIILSVVAIIAIIAIKYFTGRNKSHRDKSALEKISGTVVNKAARQLDELAEGIRDAKTVKKEMLRAIDENVKIIRQEYKIHFENLIRSRETYKNLNASTTLRINNLEETIRNLKRQFNSTNDVSYKEKAEETIRVMLEAKRIQQKSAENLANLETRIEKSKNDYQLAIMKMEEKKAEVTAMACDVAISSQYIRDLSSELKEKINIYHSEVETSQLMDEDDKIETTISQEEINATFERI